MSNFDEILALLDPAQQSEARERLEANAATVHRCDDAAIVHSLGAWRFIHAAGGPPPSIEALLNDLKETADGLVFDEGVVALPDETLRRCGVRPIAREHYVQRLDRVPDEEPAIDGIDYVICNEAMKRPAQLLVGRTHALSLEGVFLTRPNDPTARACAVACEAALHDESLITAATICACQNGAVVGIVHCNLESDIPELLGLAIDPSFRGKGLSWGLVRRAQLALKREGYEYLGFHTTDRNLPVHKLFTPDEIVSREATTVWFGMRDPLTRVWR